MPFTNSFPLSCCRVFWGPPALANSRAVGRSLRRRAFGAKGDGTTLDTAAITQAIKLAQKKQGHEDFTAGTYVTGTFRIHRAILCGDLDAGRRRGSSKFRLRQNRRLWPSKQTYGVDFLRRRRPKLGTSRRQQRAHTSPSSAAERSTARDSFMDLNTPHVGSDLCGAAAHTRDPEAFTAGVSDLKYGPVLPKEHMRGMAGTMPIFVNCKNVLVRDVTLRSGPTGRFICKIPSRLSLLESTSITICAFPTTTASIACTAACDISDSDVQAGDDDLAIFGSDDVNVTNCSLISRSAAIRLESTRHSTFDNLSIDSNRGIGIFHGPNSGDSTESVLFSNITMRTRLILGHWWGKAEPIYIAVSPCAQRINARVEFVTSRLEHFGRGRKRNPDLRRGK